MRKINPCANNLVHIPVCKYISGFGLLSWCEEHWLKYDDVGYSTILNSWWSIDSNGLDKPVIGVKGYLIP